MSASDADLLEHWRAGDRDAGNTLLQKHLQPLLRFFANKVPESDYHDLAQRSLMRCVEARDRIREGSSFRAYLFAIARNEMLMHFRRRGGGPDIELGLTSVAALGTTPSRAVARDQEQAFLVTALQSLPVDVQLLLELHYWEEMPAAELASVFDIDPTTVRTRLHRARARLRAALEEAQTPPSLRERLLRPFEPQ